MKIDLSKEEYQTLLELLEIAGWVLHAHENEQRPETLKYRELEQKLYSYAKELGLGCLVMYDKGLKQYFPTREFEETTPAMEFVEEFEEESFWDELVNRLAERDLARITGGKRAKGMTAEDRFRKLTLFQKRYVDEFEERGLDNLIIEAE